MARPPQSVACDAKACARCPHDDRPSPPSQRLIKRVDKQNGFIIVQNIAGWTTSKRGFPRKAYITQGPQGPPKGMVNMALTRNQRRKAKARRDALKACDAHNTALVLKQRAIRDENLTRVNRRERTEGMISSVYRGEYAARAVGKGVSR